MTNASSTYLSIALGAVVGALISWLIFALQKKSSIKYEENLKRLNELNDINTLFSVYNRNFVNSGFGSILNYVPLGPLQ